VKDVKCHAWFARFDFLALLQGRLDAPAPVSVP